MVVAPKYSLQTQAKIPLALAALHNFIQCYNANDDTKINDDEVGDLKVVDLPVIPTVTPINPEHLGTHISQEEKDRAIKLRNDIATTMWDDYKQVLAEQELE